MNPEIESTHKRYEKFTNDKDMRDLYEARVKYQRDIASLIDSGFERGKLANKREILVRLLKKKFEISELGKEVIASEENFDILDEALDKVIFASSLEEVMDLFMK